MGSVTIDRIQPTFFLEDADDDEIAAYIDLIILAIQNNMERQQQYTQLPSPQLRQDILDQDTIFTTAQRCTNIHIQRILTVFKTSIYQLQCIYRSARNSLRREPNFRPRNEPSYQPSHERSARNSLRREPNFRPKNEFSYQPRHEPNFRPRNEPSYQPRHEPNFRPRNRAQLSTKKRAQLPTKKRAQLFTKKRAQLSTKK